MATKVWPAGGVDVGGGVLVVVGALVRVVVLVVVGALVRVVVLVGVVLVRVVGALLVVDGDDDVVGVALVGDEEVLGGRDVVEAEVGVDGAGVLVVAVLEVEGLGAEDDLFVVLGVSLVTEVDRLLGVDDVVVGLTVLVVLEVVEVPDDLELVLVVEGSGVVEGFGSRVGTVLPEDVEAVGSLVAVRVTGGAASEEGASGGSGSSALFAQTARSSNARVDASAPRDT